MKIERAAMVGQIKGLTLPEEPKSAKPGALIASAREIRIRYQDEFHPLRSDFNFTRSVAGTQSFTVPYGVTRLYYDLRGAGGGGGGAGQRWLSGSNHRDRAGGNGGNGARLTGYIDVAPLERITVNVGSGGSAGANAYQNGTAGQSGGVSRIRRGGITLIEASGGGGGGGGRESNNTGSHGANATPTGGAPGGNRGLPWSSQPTAGSPGHVMLRLA